jgi:hypothetical protein
MQLKLVILKKKPNHSYGKVPFAQATAASRISGGLVFRSIRGGLVLRFHKFLCFDIFTGRADEDELFRTHSKFWDRAEVLHSVAAATAQNGRRALDYKGRAFDGGVESV